MSGTGEIYCGAPIRKNLREELRVTLNHYQGRDLLNIRVFYDRDGELLPGKQGVSIRATALPEIIAGLQAALVEAKRRGLVGEVEK